MYSPPTKISAKDHSLSLETRLPSRGVFFLLARHPAHITSSQHPTGSSTNELLKILPIANSYTPKYPSLAETEGRKTASLSPPPGDDGRTPTTLFRKHNAVRRYSPLSICLLRLSFASFPRPPSSSEDSFYYRLHRRQKCYKCVSTFGFSPAVYKFLCPPTPRR